MPRHTFTDDAFDRTRKVVLDAERDPPPPRNRRGRKDPGMRPPIVACLLEDLVTDGQAEAAVLEKVDNTLHQKISILGTVTGGTWTATFKNQTTAAIQWNAAAAAVETALAALSTIGTGNVKVEVGAQYNRATLTVPGVGGTFTLSLAGETTQPIPWNASSDALETAIESGLSSSVQSCTVTGAAPEWTIAVDSPANATLQGLAIGSSGTLTTDPNNAATNQVQFANPGIWIVRFKGIFDRPGAPTVPWLTVASSLTSSSSGVPPAVEIVAEGTIWRDTGFTEIINATIPVGTPTPMRAGCQVGCVWFPAIGYGFPGCEARQFNIPPGY